VSTTTADPIPAARLSAARRSTRLFFLSAGFVNAAWAPMVPFAKARTGLGTASVGAVLIGLGVGAVLIMPLVSWGLSRHGARRCMTASCALLALVLPLLAILSSPLALALALLCFGFGLGGLDAGMNAQAVEVEIRSARPLMSGFHGMFSIGGLTGSLGLTLLLAGGLSVPAAAFTMTAIFLALWLTHLSGLLPGVEPRPAAGRPSSLRLAMHPAVLLIGGLCFIGFLGEGATLDWSALFLHGKGLATAYGGIGYAAFSVTMATGRLTGDALARRWGAVRLLRSSAILAAMGWAVAVLAPGLAAVAGFALVGLGAANIVPLLFGAAARVRGVPTSVSIPLISALGYAGMLCGPAMVGFAAAATSLGVALSGVAALLLLVVSAAGVARA
jgi:predicted MFS family arabinose efflux permease